MRCSNGNDSIARLYLPCASKRASERAIDFSQRQLRKSSTTYATSLFRPINSEEHSRLRCSPNHGHGDNRTEIEYQSALRNTHFSYRCCNVERVAQIYGDLSSKISEMTE